MGIYFTFLEIEEVVVFNKNIKKLIQDLIEQEGKKLGSIHYIFTNNSKILEINQEFLNHHYYTDVITFNYNKRLCVEGDIIISIDQLLINAKRLSVNAIEELLRVMIHGVLHLIGYDDKCEKDKIVMRAKEDAYLCTFRKFDLVKKSEI